MRAILVVALMLFVLAVAYWLQADRIPVSRLAGGVGADGLPKLLAIALGVLSLALAAQSLFEMRARKREGAAQAAPSQDESGEEMGARQHLRALGLIGIGMIYLFVLPVLGYAVSAMLLLAGVATYAGLRPSLATVAFGVGGGIVFYIIFVMVLGIRLPSGFWPGLLN